MDGPPPSLRLWSMSKANPAVLNGFRVLEQAPLLWMEWEAYARAEAAAAAAARAKTDQQSSRRSRRVAGRRR